MKVSIQEKKNTVNQRESSVKSKYHLHGDSSVSTKRWYVCTAMVSPLSSRRWSGETLVLSMVIVLRHTDIQKPECSKSQPRCSLISTRKQLTGDQTLMHHMQNQPFSLLVSQISSSWVLWVSPSVWRRISSSQSPWGRPSTAICTKHKERESITAEDLMEFIKGPDFPTGGVVYNRADILSAYATGRGSVIMRGKAVIEETNAGRPVIIINELPYQKQRLQASSNKSLTSSLRKSWTVLPKSAMNQIKKVSVSSSSSSVTASLVRSWINSSSSQDSSHRLHTTWLRSRIVVSNQKKLFNLRKSRRIPRTPSRSDQASYCLRTPYRRRTSSHLRRP